MAAIGQRTRWLPPVTAQIDWAHPLSKGLVISMTADPVDHCGVGATRTGTVPPATTALGRAGYCTGGASIDSQYTASVVGPSTAPVPSTVRLIFRAVSWTGSFATLVDKGSGGNRDIGLFVDTSGNLSYAMFGGRGTGSTMPLGMTAGGTYDLVVSFDGGSTITGYVNGVRKGTLTVGGTSAAVTAPLVVGRNPSGGGTNGDLNFTLAQVWTRALSATEVAALAAEPFQMLRW
jgi:hypothetical protein